MYDQATVNRFNMSFGTVVNNFDIVGSEDGFYIVGLYHSDRTNQMKMSRNNVDTIIAGGTITLMSTPRSPRR